ncbi:MAG: LacI family DNA-binding transcriptional regulator [Anaerolineales bacterium]|nr:LacI family DNA-binding transcriptional regulator [Anaerolineales bacterium]
MKESLVKLHKIITKRFNNSELNELCFHLGIDFDNLSGETYTNKVMNLITYLERRNQIPQLIHACKELRPNLELNEISGELFYQNEYSANELRFGGKDSKGYKANGDGVETVIFYTPTIAANSFFASLLEYIVDRAVGANLNIIIEKGEPGIGFHEAGNFTNVIQKYGSNSNQPRPVLIMIPPTPDSYEDIWKLRNDTNVNLITLDMGIEANQLKKFEACDFHKKIILVDNQIGARIAAEEVVSFCSKHGIDEINTLILEGSMHGRGKSFEEELSRISNRFGLKIFPLRPLEEMSFSHAGKMANKYIKRVFSGESQELTKRETFIFCANDNMAIGARMGISNIDPSKLAQYKDIRIICFDASTFVKMHMDFDDRFLWRAIDQRYTEIINQALRAAKTIFNRENITKEIIRIEPTIYRRL